MKKADFTMPEGYLDSVQEKVFLRIGEQRRNSSGRILSHVALAASFAVLVILSGMLLKGVTPAEEVNAMDEESLLMAYSTPVTAPDLIFATNVSSEAASPETAMEDAAEYLLYDGVDIDCFE